MPEHANNVRGGHGGGHHGWAALREIVAAEAASGAHANSLSNANLRRPPLSPSWDSALCWALVNVAGSTSTPTNQRNQRNHFAGYNRQSNAPTGSKHTTRERRVSRTKANKPRAARGRTKLRQTSPTSALDGPQGDDEDEDEDDLSEYEPSSTSDEDDDEDVLMHSQRAAVAALNAVVAVRLHAFHVLRRTRALLAAWRRTARRERALVERSHRAWARMQTRVLRRALHGWARCVALAVRRQAAVAAAHADGDESSESLTSLKLAHALLARELAATREELAHRERLWAREAASRQRAEAMMQHGSPMKQGASTAVDAPGTATNASETITPAYAEEMAELREQLTDLKAHLCCTTAPSSSHHELYPEGVEPLDVHALARTVTKDAVSRAREARASIDGNFPSAARSTPHVNLGRLLGTPTPTQLLPDPPQQDDSAPLSVVRNLYAAIERL
ncbi:hypothetical protein RI054_03g17560 [Pseudoscourfieldia marina]